MPTTHRRCRGVTFFEVIIVISIFLIVASLLLPAVLHARQAADRSQSINQLKMLGLATHNFHDVNRGLPPIAGKMNNQDGSLHFHLLPYMEEANVYREAQGNSWKVANRVIAWYIDADDKSLPEHLHQNAIATTNYAGNWLGFKDGMNRLTNFLDGTSNTMAFATRYQLCNGTPTAWAYSAISTWTPMFGYYSHAKFQVNPKQKDCDPQVPQTIGRVMIVAVFDGSARPLNENISPHTWHAATTPAGGEILGGDWQ